MAKFTDISIHAPAKGATAIIVAVLIMFALISIHAPAKGATYYGTFDMSILNSFQSTLPRRERPFGIYHRVTGFYNFNPRSREGSDSKDLLHRLNIYDFNPRSREGSDGVGVHFFYAPT